MYACTLQYIHTLSAPSQSTRTCRLCTYVHMYKSTYVRMYVHTYVCMYICMCVCVCVCVYVTRQSKRPLQQ